jgi:hypothetical protein
MSITIRVKSKEIVLSNLNDDCNYEINKYALSALSYINWSLSELKMLNKSSLIQWEIYSSNNYHIDIYETFAPFIKFDIYLAYVEQQYKQVNSDILKKIIIMVYLHNNMEILKYHIVNNKYFYFSYQPFLLEFRELFNIYDYDDINRYISADVLIYFIDLLSLPNIERLLNRLSVSEEVCDAILNRFSRYPYCRHELSKIIFTTQSLSFSFIESREWSYDSWITILENQNLTNDNLMHLLKKINIMKYLVSRYGKLSEEFITNSISYLDKDVISEYQKLTYEFVKAHHNIINFELLSLNTNLNFSIYEVNKESVLESPQYIIINPNNQTKNVIFID